MLIEPQIGPVVAGVPADVAVECTAIPAPPSPPLTAVDDCTTPDPIVAFVELGDRPTCSYVITRLWDATCAGFAGALCSVTPVELQSFSVER